MNSLTNLNNYYIPNTLDGINQIQSHVSENALLVDGSNTMEADLDVGGNNVKNLANGVAIDEAVNKGQLDTKADLSYVNTQDNLRVLKAGDTMTGNLNMGSNKVNVGGTSFSGNQVPNTQYIVDKFVNTYTTNVADGIKVWQNMNIYSAVSAPTSEQLNTTNVFHSRDLFPKWSEGMTNPASDNYIISRWTGAATSNDIIIFRHTTNDIQFNQPLTMSSNIISNVANGASAGDAVNKSQLDLKADTTYVNTQLALKADTTYVNTQDNLRVLKAGDTMTGSLSFGTSYKVTNLADPTANRDGAHKKYVDDLDLQDVKITGAQTIAGIKTFSSSPVVPDATLSTQTASYGQVTTLDAQNVKITGSQSIAGTKTFSSGIGINSASPQLSISNGGTNAFTWTQGGGGTVTQTASGNMTLNATAGTLFLQSNAVSKLTVNSTGALMAGSIDMSTTNKIINLASGSATADAVNYGQLSLKADTTYVNGLDAQNVKLTGAQTIADVKTFSSSPIVPTATTSTQAVNKGQMDTEFSSKERSRTQGTACQLWRKVSGTDVSIWGMALGWSIDAHADPVAASGSTGLAYTNVDKGVFLRTHMVLYKGDSINGFFFSPDSNTGAATVKIWVYDWGENLVATTELSTVASNKLTCFLPFTTAWTVPSTQTYKVCLVYQSGNAGVETRVLTCASIWVTNFNTMACAYYNQYLGLSNQTPPVPFYDLFDTTLGRIAMIFAYRTI